MKEDLSSIRKINTQVGFEDILSTFKSGFSKSIDFVLNFGKNLSNINSTEGVGFLESLNEAHITPNNITTFRVFLLCLGILLYYSGNNILALSILTTSCVLDLTDGKLARKYNQGSIEGETFDAGVDKISDISLTAMSTIVLVENSVLATLNGIIGVGKAYYHKLSQFREGRPGINTQIAGALKCSFNDENIIYNPIKTKAAANDFGKYKTLLQFTSGLGILWTNELESLIDMGLADEILEYIFVSMSGVSIILAGKSIGCGKK